MKRCSKCHRLLQDTDFYVRRDNDTLQSQCKDCCKAHGRLRNGTTGIYKTDKDMQEFKFWDIPVSLRTGHARMKEDEMSINCKKGNHSITFNQEVSKSIIDRGLTRLRIGEMPYADDIYLVVGREKDGGMRICRTGKKVKNITCSNKEAVKRLYQRLGISDSVERYIAHISKNISNSQDYFTVRINK